MKKLLSLILLAYAGAASAQTADFVQLVPSFYLPKDVNFSAGAVTLSMPKYTGADENRFALYPMFDAQWKNGAFASARNGLGYDFSKNPAYSYGVRLSFHGARDESRTYKLRGLGDVNTAIEPGAFFNLNLNNNFSLLSSIRYGSGLDHDGLQLSLGASASTIIAPQHRISASVGATWSNSAYMQSYYGVSAGQSITSGYAKFTPSSGVSELKLSANWHWTINNNWSLVSGASYGRLTGDASKSPFVFQRSPVTVFTAANYRF